MGNSKHKIKSLRSFFFDVVQCDSFGQEFDIHFLVECCNIFRYSYVLHSFGEGEVYTDIPCREPAAMLQHTGIQMSTTNM